MSVVCSMYVVCVCTLYVVICKIDHCIHIHWCIVMGLGHNDPWVESHMWPQQTWGQRSSRGQWPFVQVFGKKGQCNHILWCIFKSNITMIAKVCDRESRRDSWFENRLVFYNLHKDSNSKPNLKEKASKNNFSTSKTFYNPRIQLYVGSIVRTLNTRTASVAFAPA